MKNFMKSFLFTLSIFAITNNQVCANTDNAILQTVKSIATDDLTNLNKNELQERTEILKKITKQTNNKEEQKIINAKIELLDQIMNEKYQTLWKKVKQFVSEHKLAISTTTVIIIAASIVTIILLKKHYKRPYGPIAPMRIEELELYTDVYPLLQNAGINFVEELTPKKINELEKTPKNRIGKGRAREIREAIAKKIN